MVGPKNALNSSLTCPPGVTDFSHSPIIIFQSVSEYLNAS